MSYSAWFDEQYAKPQTLHRLYLNQAAADAAAIGKTVLPVDFFNSWWSQALGGDDQLRQRAAFALSELFVISFSNATVAAQPRGVASYYDMLGANAFGNFRDLLDGVTYHPMMGIFLSDLKNQKEDPTTGRVPDLNFAREVTQLFTVGEWKLNADGSQIMGSNGDADARLQVGRSRAASRKSSPGLSWYAGTDLTDRTNARFFGNNPDPSRDWMPMQDYNQYTANTSFHSVSQKSLPRRDDRAAVHARHGRRRQDRARHALQQPERRTVRRQAADPAPGDEQSEPGLRQPRRCRLQRQRQGRSRRHEGGVAGHPSRHRSAHAQHVDERRQAARAAAAHVADAARVQRHLAGRSLHRHRPHRRPGDPSRPDADVRADRLQLLPARLCAVR